MSEGLDDKSFAQLARADSPGAAGISAFIVPAGLPGLSLGLPGRKMGREST